MKIEKYILLKELPGVKAGSVFEMTIGNNGITNPVVDLKIDGKTLTEYQVKKYCSMINYMTDEGDLPQKPDWFQFVEETVERIEPISYQGGPISKTIRLDNLEMTVNKLVEEHNERKIKQNKTI